MADAACVLVVDDDPGVVDLLQDYLGGYGFEVLTAGDGTAARALLERHRPQVLLLDVGLPGEDGLSLARHVRERFDIGIIMISGAGETVDRIVGIEVGADDYLTKPFDPRELHARLKSVLRRYQRPVAGETVPGPPAGGQRIPFGGCSLDLDSRRLFDADGNEVPVTQMEFELLSVFAERPNRPLTRDQLMTLTRNREWDPFDRSIDIRIARLRRKVEPDPKNPRVLRTVRGFGYMFVPPGKE